MAFKIPNSNSPLVNKITGTIIQPWMAFFQQFTNAAQPIASINVGTSPFQLTQNDIGHFLISGGTVSNIQIKRGQITVSVAADTSVPRLVPISLGDTIIVTYTVLPTMKFIPQFG